MKFEPTGFRPLDVEYCLDLRNNQHMTLILVEATGKTTYDYGRCGKDDIVKKFNPDKDLLMLAWTGQYKTAIFALGVAELEKHYVYLDGSFWKRS